jgi:hypothetical protein
MCRAGTSNRLLASLNLLCLKPADQRMDNESRPGQVAGGINWASSYLTECRQYNDAKALPDLARRLHE